MQIRRIEPVYLITPSKRRGQRMLENHMIVGNEDYFSGLCEHGNLRRTCERCKEKAEEEEKKEKEL
jgi:hypothetical protein